MSNMEQQDQFDDDSVNADAKSETNLEVNRLLSIKAGRFSFNPVTPSGRKWHQMQMILLPFIPIAFLVIQICYSVSNIISFQKEVRLLQRQVDAAVEMGTVLTTLQRERVELAYYIFTNGTVATSRKKFQEAFRLTDLAIDKVHTWPTFSDPGAAHVLGSKLRFQIRLGNLRSQIAKYGVLMKSKVSYYTRVSAHIMDAVIQNIKDTSMSNIWKYMLAYKDVIRAVEYFGISMVEGLNFFAEGTLDKATYVNYVTHDFLGWKTLNKTEDFVEFFRETFTNMTHRHEILQDIHKWRKIIFENNMSLTTVNLKDADNYFYAMVKLSDKLRKMQNVLLVLIKNYMRNELNSADTRARFSILLLVSVLCISPIIIFLIRNASMTIQSCAAIMISRTNQLKKMKRICNRFFFLTIPQHLPLQFTKMQACSFDMVTVYICDFIGIAELVSESSPTQSVDFLNSLYNLMDSRIRLYDVFKVENMGNSYMVVSGAPKINGHMHVTEIARMSLDLVDSIANFSYPHRPKRKGLVIKSGFHSGSVVAGIVGRKLQRYCLFGNTVNIAKLMESTGEAMKIQITTISKELLELNRSGTFKHHGKQIVNGETFSTYWLISCP